MRCDHSSPAAPRRGRFGLVFLAGAALLGCVFDEAERCGENQVFSATDGLCVCEPGAAKTEQGCVPCGVDEVAGPNGCACPEGFTRPTPEAACELVPSALGLACDTVSAPCADARYDHCQIVSGTSGYCTSADCTSSAECENGYACDTTASPAFCRRPPLGAGQPCSSAADCAGTEATHCDAVVSRSCLVEGCTLSPNNCFEGMQCCDLSAFGLTAPLCVPQCP
jgi:hypothetical protein